MSDKSLSIPEAKKSWRRRRRKSKTSIDGHETDPILDQYSYSSAEDEYRCLRCEYRTKRHLNVRQHMVSHSDVRPYRCHDCPAAYKRPQELKRHVKIIHLRQKPFQCHFFGCDKTFTQLQSLKDHIHGQHTRLRYRCLLDGCGRRLFTCRTNLRSHQRRRHYNTLPEAIGGQQLPFNEWINAVANNYDVVDAETEDQSLSSSSPQEVSDDSAAIAVSTEAPPSPPPPSLLPSPPVSPVYEISKSVAVDDRRRLTRSMADNSGRTYGLGSSGQPTTRQRRGQYHYSLGPSQTPQFVYECNFNACLYTTGDFDEIADHFIQHWDYLNADSGEDVTDDNN